MPTPIRLKEYGVGIFIGALTKSAFKKAIKKKLITVDNVIATSATFIYGGEHIKLSIAEKANSYKKFILSLKVIYEDEFLAVIHKPAGIIVSGSHSRTIAKVLSQNVLVSTIADACKPHPVHRLDFATTGLLLVGKTSSSIRILNKMFEEKKIEKTYYAITIGAMDTEGTIFSEIDGKEAKTRYKVCESVPSKRFDQLNLLQLYPHTGRRHQLRNHLSSIGHPILGDKQYGIENLILYGKGMYLHAYALQFMHPFTNRQVSLIDELPLRFQRIFKTNL